MPWQRWLRNSWISEKDVRGYDRMKLGIIGTGRIAKRAVKELAEVSGIESVFVFNPNFEHAKRFVDNCFWGEQEEKNAATGDEKYYTRNISKLGNMTAVCSLENFVGCVDAVYIASPHDTHYTYSRQILEAGKNVICEKPMALKEIQVKELFDIAQDRNLVLMEAIKTEFCPGLKKLEEVIKNGVIGEVVDVEAAFTRLTEPGGREFSDVAVGGSFTEFGTYCMLPIFRFLGTEYDEVQFLSLPAETKVDGYTKAIFTYKKDDCQKNSDNSEENRLTDGADVICKTATAKTGLTVKSEGQLLISGTKGYILVPSPWWLTKYFEVRYEDPLKVEKYECEFLGDGLRYEFREFIDRINAGRVTANQKEEAIARAKVYESFLKQYKE